MNAPVSKDTKLSEVELTDDQRKRTLALYRESDGAYHDLFIACAHVIVLRDRIASHVDLMARLKDHMERMGFCTREEEPYLEELDEAIQKATQS
jgi:hypothetical protein